MPTPWQRDLEQARKNLADWMRRRLPEATALELSPLTAPGSSGFSNETLLFDASWREGGEPRAEKLVVRIQPTGFQIFPHYDMGLQFRTMELLGPTDVPVPKTFWQEKEDVEVLGAPFYVMGRVEGRVPSDNPPYNVQGWLTELPPEDVAAIWWGGIDCLARIQRLDYRAVGFGFLDQPELGETGIERQIALYERYLEWAACGRPQPTAESALEWLVANRPTGEPHGLVWGDARIGNILFDGTRPAAVLDWEMVSVGSPELDLGWTLFMDRFHSEGVGAERLPGFPSHDETVARYEELTGHRVRHRHYYEVFAGFRFAVITMRIAQQLVYYEAMDEAAGRAFELDNMVTRPLAKLLDLPEPQTHVTA